MTTLATALQERFYMHCTKHLAFTKNHATKTILRKFMQKLEDKGRAIQLLNSGFKQEIMPCGYFVEQQN